MKTILEHLIIWSVFIVCTLLIVWLVLFIWHRIDNWRDDRKLKKFYNSKRWKDGVKFRKDIMDKYINTI
jgi:hypothetical protein